jgi:hypothetical protein
MTPGWAEARSRIEYQDKDGLMVPWTFLETRASKDRDDPNGPMKIHSTEEAIVIGFTITPIDETTFPTLEIPKGQKIFNDDCGHEPAPLHQENGNRADGDEVDMSDPFG